MSQPMSQPVSRVISGKKNAALYLPVIGSGTGKTRNITRATHAVRSEAVYIAGYFTQTLAPEREVRP